MSQFKPNIEQMKEESNIPGLMQCLDNADDDIRYRAFSALASGPKLDYQAVTRLKKMLKDPNPRVRSVAALKFSDMRSRVVPGNLKEIISRGTQTEKFELLRIIAGCSRISDADILEIIVIALSDHKELVRTEAARTAGVTGNPHLIPRLAECLHDKIQAVRIQAAKSLFQIGGKESVGYLVPLLEDRSDAVQEEAGRLLKLIKSDAARKAVHEHLLRKITRSMKDVAPVRARTVSEIRIKRLREFLPLIHAASMDRFKGVRKEALKAIAAFGDQSSVDFVAKLLHDRYHDVRIEAVRALGEIVSEASLQALGPALEDENGEVRREAKTAAAKLRAAVRH